MTPADHAVLDTQASPISGSDADDRVWRPIAYLPADPWEALEFVAPASYRLEPQRISRSIPRLVAAGAIAIAALCYPSLLQRSEPLLVLGTVTLQPAPKVEQEQPEIAVPQPPSVPGWPPVGAITIEATRDNSEAPIEATAADESPEVELPAIALAQNAPPDLIATAFPQTAKTPPEPQQAAHSTAPLAPLPAVPNASQEQRHRAAAAPTEQSKGAQEDVPEPPRPRQPAKPDARKAPPRAPGSSQSPPTPSGDAVRSFFFQNGL